MALKIIWAKEAEIQLDEVIIYLEDNWSELQIKKFFKRLEEGILSIQKAPNQHKKSIRKIGTHEFQLSKQTTIFYRFDEKEITILLLWPNRKNPKNLN